MRTYTSADAEAAVGRALAGHGTAFDAEILVDLFRRASGKKADRDAANRAITVEREANALAAVLADILHASDETKLERPYRDVVDELPRDARRRVIAYRHKLRAPSWMGARDQWGPLPTVPPRASVMRDSARTIDADVVDDPVRVGLAAIEGTVVSVSDEPV